MPLSATKRLTSVTRRALRKTARRRRVTARFALVATVLFGLVVSSAPTAQAVVQSNTPVNATAEGSDATTLTDLGSKVNLKVLSPVADPGSLTQSVTQYIDKTRMVLTSLQDITAPADWTLKYSTDNGATWSDTTPTTTAGWAAVNAVKATGPVVSDGTDGSGLQISTGDATQAYPAGGSVNAAASGDGYNLMFDERGNFYNIWHHNGAGSPGIDCHTRAGARCAGAWPYTWATGAESGPNTVTKSYGWYDPVDHEIWFSSNMYVGGVGRVGFACVNVRAVASPGWCGGSKLTAFHDLQNGGVGGSGYPGLGAAAGRIFTLNPSTGDVLCLDLRADFGNGAPCSTPAISFPSYPTAQQYTFDGQYGGYAIPTLQAIAGRIYAYFPVNATKQAFVCLEPETMSICAGWEGAVAGDPKNAVFNTAHIWPLPNAAGEIQAICGGGTWVGCYNFDGTVFTGTKPPDGAVVGSYQLEAYGESDPVVVGSKILSPRLSGADTHYIRCWDMATNTNCTGINGKVTNIGLYTVNVDPYNETCIWTNTDPGIIQTWDLITGSNSCTPRSIAFDASVVVPRMGCDTRTGIHAWKEFTLTSPAASTYSAAYLTIKTEDATNVTGWVKVPITTGTAVDLSNLPVSETGQRPKFVVSFDNRTSGTDANAKVSAIGDAPELCLTPTVLTCIPSADSGPVGSNDIFGPATVSLTGKGDWTTGGNILNNLADDASSVTLPAGEYAECASKITGTARNTSATGTPVPGATVTLLDSSGNVVNYPSDWPVTGLRGQPVQTTTGSDGTYDLGWVYAGDYKVRFSDVPTTQVKSTNVVTGTTATTKTTTDSGFTSTTLASITATPVIGTNAVVDAIYTVLPTLTKNFVPDTISAGGTGALVFTLTNAPNNPAQSGLGFVDTLPDGLVVAAIPNRQYTCPGGGNTVYKDPAALTATAGSSTITALNFSMNAGTASCFFSVDVTSVNGGSFTNGAGNVTTTGIAPPNTSSLTVLPVTTPGAFLCTPTLYHNDSTQFKLNGLPDYTKTYNIGAVNINVTALGFNGLDGFIYGIANQTASPFTTDHLIKIDNTGAKTDLGAVTGTSLFTASASAHYAGDMDDSGHLLLFDWNTPTKLFSIDVYTRVVTTITLSGATLNSNDQDWAYKDGKLYSVNGQQLQVLNVATGFVTNVALPAGVAITTESAYMTMDGRLIVYDGYQLSNLREIVGFTGSSPTVTNLGWAENADYSDGTACHDATPAPATRPDTTSAAQGATQTAHPLANDIPSTMVGAQLDPSTVKLCDTGETAPNCSATTLTKPEGTYTVNSAGDIIFTPNPSFTGVAGGVTYQVTDNKGESSTGTYTPTSIAPPAAVNDTSSGAYLATQTVNPVTNDSPGVGGAANGTTLVQNSVRLCDGSDVAPNCTHTSVTVPGQGTYTVDTTTGIISFVPVVGFTGAATPVTYSVTDSLGQKSTATYTPTVNGAPRISKEFVPNSIVAGSTSTLVFTVTNTTGNPAWSGLGFVDTLPTGLVVAAIPNKQTTCPAGADTPLDNPTALTAAAGATSITLAGATITSGVAKCMYSVDVTATATGTYSNGAGNITSTTMVPPATIANLGISSANNPGQFLCTPAIYHSESTQFYVNGAPDYSTAFKLGSTISAGDITGLGFNGLDGYVYGIKTTAATGLADGHLIRIDSTGAKTDMGALTGATLPQTNIGGDMDDSGHLILFGWNDTSKIFVVDVYTRNVTTISLSNPNGAGKVLSNLAQDFAYKDGKLYSLLNTSLAIIDVATGVISWKSVTPSGMTTTTTSAYMTDAGRFLLYDYSSSHLKEVVGFSGLTPSVADLGADVAVLNSDGTACHDATPAPATRNDTTFGAKGATQTASPLTNDIASSMVGASLVPSSLRLCDTGQVAPNCSATTLTKPEGTYTVNSSGEIIFVPNPTFTGVAGGVTYQVTDNKGESSTGTYTPTVVAPPTAVNDATSAAYMATQTVNPVTATGTADSVGVGAAANGVTLQQNSVRLCGPSDTAPNCSQTSVTFAGQGTYTVDTTTGIVTWTPVTGFAGTATPVTYSITDTLGQKASATYTPTTNAAPRMSKAFGPDTIAAGGVTSVTFTITNTTPAAAWTNLAFIDTLPSGVTVDANPNVTKTCTAGTVTATASSGTITVTGVPLAATTASCSITVEVKIVSAGSYTNGASNISSTTVMPPTDPATVTVVSPITTGSFACNPYVFTERTGGILVVQNPLTGSANQLGAAAGGEIQALGFNALDGYLYGYVRASLTSPVVAAGHIVKISSTGTVTDVGVPKLNGVNLAANANVYAGDMDDAGNLFFLSNYQSTTTAYLVNVSTLVTRQITLSTGIGRQDVAFFKGKFYTAETTTVYVITPNASSDSWNVATPTTMSPSTSGTQQAAYSNSAEFFYLAATAGFKLVNNVTGASPTVTALGTDTYGSQTDGAGCHQAAGLYTPAATNDTITTAYNTQQVYTPLSNDVPSLSGAALNPASVKLCAANETTPNCTQTTLTVAGQGTYTVNTTTGAVTFVPLSTFTGTATPVNYQVSDTASTPKTATATLSPVIGPPPAPTATNDSSVAGLDVTQTVNPLTNDTVATGFTLVATSVKLCASGTTTNCALTTLTVAGKGVYSVNPTTGAISFDPDPTYVGSPPPVTYSVTDSSGQTATATYSPTVVGAPTATNEVSSGAWDSNQTLRPLTGDSAATGATLAARPQGICLVTTFDVACTGTTVVIANQGTYTLNADGTVTFDPLPSFTGTATAIKYVVADSLGQLAHATLTPTVAAGTAPEATPETEVVIPGGTLTFTTLTGTGGLATPGEPAFDTTKTCLITPGSNPATCDADGVVTIAGEGTYTLNQSTGVVTFVAAANITSGTKTPLTYKVVDVTGASATSTLTPIVPPPPVVRSDTVAGQLGSTLTIPLLSNDEPGSNVVDLVPESIRLCQVDDPTTSGTNEAQTPPNCDATRVVKPEGTFELDPQTGILTFTPDPTYTGTLPANPTVTYVVEDTLGQTGSGTATATILPPPATTATPDIGSALFQQDVVFNPLSNDSPGTVPAVSGSGYTQVGTVALNPASVRLCDPVSGACNLTELVVPGEGTYTVNTTTGAITFSPEVTFFGTPVSAPTYKICNTVGGTWAPATPVSTCSTATVTPTVAAPVAPNAVDDNPVAGAWDTNQTINPLSNDTKDPLLTLDPTTLHLCAAGQQAPNCTATTLTIPGQGTYTVNQATGVVTFDPLPSFSGTATPVTYQVSDTMGFTDSAALTVSVTAPPAPTAADASISLADGAAQSFPPISSGSSPLATGTQLQTAQTFLCDTTETAPNCTATTVTVPGVGTYTLDQATGVVTFDGVDGSSTASSVDYIVTDVLGRTESGTLSANPIAPPVAVDDTLAAAYDQTRTINVLSNDSSGAGTTLVASTLKLCATGEVEPGCTATNLVVPGVGTYTVLPGGNIEFNPEATFKGTAPAVTYQISDGVGQTTSATLITSVTTASIAAADDNATGAYDTNIVFTPASNDSVGATNFANTGYITVGTVSVNTGSVRLCGPSESAPSCSQTTLTTADGVYTVNPTTGAVTFDPDADFIGSATQPVDYQVCNQLSGTWSPTPASTCDTATLFPTTTAPAHPVALSDSPTLAWNTTTPIDVLANDSIDPALTVDPATVLLCGTGEVSPNCTQTTLTVPGEGTYTVNPDGTVSFDPVITFTGAATPIRYQATDSFGQALTSTIAPSVTAPPVVSITPDTATTAMGQPVTENLLTDDTTTGGVQLVPSSVKLCAPNETTPNCSVAPGTDLTVPGVGTYNVSTSGVVTFTPDPSYVGTPTPITYQVTDNVGRVVSSTFTPTVVAPPVLTDDSSTGAYNTAQSETVLVNDSSNTGTALSPSTVKLCASTDTAPNCTATTVNVPGQGTYSVNTTTGVITFTPVASFTGTATGVTYSATDSLGQKDSALYTPTVTAPAAPTGVVDSTTGAINLPQTVNPLSNDTTVTGVTLDPTTVKLCDPTTNPAQTPPNCTLTTLTNSAGTYVVNPTTGVITFTPVTGFTGTAPAVTYQATTNTGQTDTSTYTASVALPPAPVGVADATSGAMNQPQTVNPLTNDTTVSGVTLVPTSVKLCDPTTNPAQAPPNCTLTTLTNSAGTYTVNPTTGVVTFTPVTGFTGTAPAVTYQATTNTGQTDTSTYTATVLAPPTLVDDSSTGAYNTAQTKAVLTNDASHTGTALSPSTLTLCDPATNPAQSAPNCTLTTLTIPGEGTYSVNTTTGVITFTPVASFTSAATPVTYQATDSLGQSADAQYTPSVTPPPAPTATADATTGAMNQPQTVNPLTNDTTVSGVTIDPTTVKLCDPTTNPAQTPPNCTLTTLTNAAGTYTVNPTTGVITFTPVTGFTGAAPSVTYQATTNTHQIDTSTYTATVIAPPTVAPDSTTGAYLTPQTSTVLTNDASHTGTALSGSTVKLCGSTDTAPDCTATTLRIPGEGTYSVNAAGSVTFTPEATFAGVATPITYSVTDSLGQKASTTYTPTVTPPVAPVATPDRQVLLPGGTVSFDNIIGMTPTTIPLATGTGLQSGATDGPCLVDGSSCVTSLTTADGAWTIDQTTGVATFTANSSGLSVGNLTPVTYRVTDITGQTATSTLTPVIPPVPIANPDTSRGVQGATQFVSLLGNDRPGSPVADLVPSSAVFDCSVNNTLSTHSVYTATVSACTTTSVTVTGEGTYTILANGVVRFEPVPEFSGTGTALHYTVEDELGQTASSTMQAVVVPPPAPIASVDLGSAPYGQTVTLSPWLNDSAGVVPATSPEASLPKPELLISSIRLCDQGQSAPNCTATTVTTDDGTYVLNTTTGKVVFTPVDRFFGTATSPVTYQISNNWTGSTGHGVSTALLIPTIAPPGSPFAANDVYDTAPMEPITFNPVSNDTRGTFAFDPTSVKLCAAGEIAPLCTATEVTVEVGVFSVNSVTGEVTFTPNEKFDLEHPAHIDYIVADMHGNVVAAAITVNDPPTPVVKTVAALVNTGLNVMGGPMPLALFTVAIGFGFVAVAHTNKRRTAAAAGGRPATGSTGEGSVASSTVALLPAIQMPVASEWNFAKFATPTVEAQPATATDTVAVQAVATKSTLAASTTFAKLTAALERYEKRGFSTAGYESDEEFLNRPD